MSIVSMSDILAEAKSKGIAVGCFNCLDFSMARGIIRAAEDENTPVILCHAEVHFKYVPLESAIPILLEEASRAKIPVALLLDHGKDYNSIVKALHLGINSIMFDGSELGYEDNINQTKEIVKIAHALDATVEGELGRVVRPADAGADGSDDASLTGDSSLYTDPDQAADFVKKTGVDALACAFGTVHGVYRNEPKLDFPRLKDIADKTGVPIVMHGGSGLSKEDIHEAIKNGVVKINYYTNLALYVGNEIKRRVKETEEPFYHNIMVWAQEAVYEDTRKAIGLFKGSS